MRITEARERRLRAIVALLDLPGLWVGRVVAWLIIPLIGVLVYEVIMRYGMNRPTMWAYDITYSAPNLRRCH